MPTYFPYAVICVALVAVLAISTMVGRNTRKKLEAQAAPGNSPGIRTFALLQLLDRSTRQKYEMYRQTLMQLLHDQVKHLDYKGDPAQFLEYDRYVLGINCDPMYRRHGVAMNRPQGWYEAHDHHHPGSFEASQRAAALLNEGAPDRAELEHLLRMHAAGTVTLAGDFAQRLHVALAAQP